MEDRIGKYFITISEITGEIVIALVNFENLSLPYPDGSHHTVVNFSRIIAIRGVRNREIFSNFSGTFDALPDYIFDSIYQPLDDYLEYTKWKFL